MDIPPTIVLINPKYPHNLAAAVRACACWGATSLRYTGDRIETPIGPKGKPRLPRELRLYRSVSVEHTEDPLHHLADTPIIGVELVPGAMHIQGYQHPTPACYVFGPEDGSIPQKWRRHCYLFLKLPSDHCLNLAACINCVLFHRRLTR